MKRILSIDGGGIRGIIPARILAAIEARTLKRTATMFDLIAGTSTGGILALGLAKPNNDGSPQYSASSLGQLYHDRGAEIFSRVGWRRWLPGWAPGNILASRYGSAGIETVLEEYFGDKMLSTACTRLLITAYDIEHRHATFFDSARALTDERYNFPMRDVARATSAAPTFFPPALLDTPALNGDYMPLVDGGLFANNPAMCAYVEARRIWPDEPIFLLSIGTGTATRPIPYQNAVRFGVAKWAPVLLDCVMDGVSDTVEYQADVLLGKNHVRFQPELEKNQCAMDDASSKHTRDLELKAVDFISRNGRRLDEVCEVLAA